MRPNSAELRVAIIGLGLLGKSILHSLAGKEFVREIHCYSKSYRGDYSPLLADLWSGYKKVVFHNSLVDILSPDTDLALICTGCPIPDLQNSYRERVLPKLYTDSLPKLFPVFSALKDRNYSGLISLFSNPPGAHLITARRRFGLASDQLTSFGPDSTRTRGLLLQVIETLYLLENLGMEVTVESLLNAKFQSTDYMKLRKSSIAEANPLYAVYNESFSLPVIGEHGSEIPLLDDCSIGGVPIGEIHPLLVSVEFAHQFTRKVRRIGDDNVRILQKDGGAHYTVVHAVARMIDQCWRITNRQSSSHEAYIQTFVPDLDAFIGAPAVLTGPPLRVSVSPIFSLAELPFEIREELHLQAKKQRQTSAFHDDQPDMVHS